jgi:hypothetical protein
VTSDEATEHLNLLRLHSAANYTPPQYDVGMAAPIKDWIALTAKLKRAEEHIFNLREFWSGFIDAGAYPILSQDVPDRSYRLYYLGSVRPFPLTFH